MTKQLKNYSYEAVLRLLSSSTLKYIRSKGYMIQAIYIIYGMYDDNPTVQFNMSHYIMSYFSFLLSNFICMEQM